MPMTRADRWTVIIFFVSLVAIAIGSNFAACILQARG
jgi:hypothetical protein